MRLHQPVKNAHSELRLHLARLNVLSILIICFSVILVGRLAYLQIAQYKRYATLSLKNQMSIIPIPPPRGIIVDRNEVVIAENIPVYALEIIPEHVKNMPDTIKRLQALLPAITAEDIDSFEHARRQSRAYMSIPFKLKLSQEEVVIFASNQYQFPGVSIKARLMRNYPLAEMTAHLLGYVGRINLQELQQADPINYRATNFIGKAGIENYYENLLHGQVGYQQVETDVSGRTLRVINKQSPISGRKLILTIDTRLQKAAYEALLNKRGAVVAIDSTNGEILAMASSPSYDPNIFVNGINAQEYNKLANAKERPLFNRAVRGLYPPASTIKPYIALTGLEKGVVDTNFGIYDPGWFKLPNVSHAYRDWKKTGHGIVNVSRAIMVSCDTYFYQLGHRLGINAMEQMVRKFGFGNFTKVDLAEEAPGIVPNAAWKRKTKGVSWYPGDTVISAIGQGFMLASPLQLANAAAALSQKGNRHRPHLLQKSLASDTEQIYPYEQAAEEPIKLNNEANWQIIIDAMHAVITNNEGTGYRFGRNAPYSVAGKTGTAQVFSGRQYEKVRYENIPEFLRDHSLFIAFAPVEKPEIAIAVIVENDFLAATVARKVMDTYFELKTSETPQ